LPAEEWDENMHAFGDPSIVFEDDPKEKQQRKYGAKTASAKKKK